MKNMLLTLLAVSAGLVVAPSQAWTPPSVGMACKGLRGGGPQVERIAGNYLGGRLIRNGIVDRKSFQSCFRTVEHCEGWLAEKALRYPLQPGFANCTRVVLR
ncbi:MAG TPA: hypothetical protein PKW21_12870 [Rhabdaerophilum sp.]|nr:hypothetical protein [Rhabdaerophilum sp.]